MTLVIFRNTFILLALCLIALPSEGQFHFHGTFRLKNHELHKALDGFAKLENLKGASWGLAIRNLKDGTLLVEKSANENFIPASNMKLLTSLNAFHNLGEKYTFKTRVFTDGQIDQGILNGNLLIEGNGDPSIATDGRDKLKSAFFTRLIESLKKQGVQSVKGEIRTIKSENPYQGIRKDWTWSDIGNYYGAGIFPLNINENQFHTYIDANREGTPAKVRRRDSLAGNIDLSEIDLETSSAGSPDMAYYYWVPGTNKIRLEGSVPQENESQRIKGSLQDPETVFIQVLKKELEKAGIQVMGEALKGNGKLPLTSLESPTLSSIAAEVNLNSNNLMTEALAYAMCGKGDRCLENGWTHLERFAKLTDFPPGYYLADGSGLSLSNRISPAGLSNSLVWAMKQEWKDAFLSTLPIAGISGTMKNFCKGATGKIQAKSGTLTRTLCYSGYAETAHGKVAFSLMVNNYHGAYKEMKEQVGKLLESFTRIH